MEFGVFFELSVPRPFAAGVERAVYENALSRLRLADTLGFDTVWAVEHHFLEEYSHCPAPEVFLTACAVQTRRIRVGHGAVVCVPEMNHPVRVAERAAAWGDARIVPTHPVSASIAGADVTLPKLRYLCRPDVWAFDGTERL